jgi:hypothetical protein
MSDCQQIYEYKILRRKWRVTLNCRPTSENANHFTMLFRGVPGDARLESIQVGDEDDTVELLFVEEVEQK